MIWVTHFIGANDNCGIVPHQCHALPKLQRADCLIAVLTLARNIDDNSSL